MATIANIPIDVLLLIFDHLDHKTETEGGKDIAACRFVCRKWANLLYQHHLYRRILFKSSDRVMHFIRAVSSQSLNGLAFPICLHLAVERIWTWGPPLDRFGTAQTKFLDLDALIDLFSDTIAELTIGVTNFFTLPSATIERIGRLKRLRALRIRIGFSSKKKHMRGLEFTSDQIPGGLPTDSECLCKLLKAAQRFATLDLGYFRPVCSAKTIAFSLGNHEFSSITNLRLAFKETGNITQDGIVSMSSALPNLKLLAIWGNGFNHSQDLLPIFETFSNRLEVIQFSNHLFLDNILDLHFPKLRVLRFYTRPNEVDIYIHMISGTPFFATFSTNSVLLDVILITRGKKSQALWK
ncbi:hypothetical protein PGT21_017990 [Puccinia graminis f. sp. tritici]|uniref:F-box domain-containing protein n=1 Tax=Puccinia graminis f. sp. tritici TaxID=56615 RepID=A0A5B0PVY8_PUCGR|nr:hypothetical protein PGT21_017990 [Puccinia graminis f. sp. tritici]